MKNFIFIITISMVIFLFHSCQEEIPEELPNILWITSEDNSPFLGCYGDEFATTPNLDKLASEGILYTHAYANAPVCAPARNTIITGVYANSGGHEPMRSTYKKSDAIHFYPEYLREKGYYCTNNWKEDYNIDKSQLKNIWNESGRNAHYKNRDEGQPFFAIFNSTLSHESSIHPWKPDSALRHDPAKVTLPPYHPDIPAMRHDWAYYYDNVEDMDTWVGKILQELDESGQAENTIVFYYGDHGGVLGRSKRFIYESGTRVPFIVRIPEKYKYLLEGKKPGTKEDRIISFVDLAPTLLSIIGTEIPDYMQGSAFLGKQKTRDPEYAYMFRGRMDERYDMIRSVRSDKFRYNVNYMPYRPYGQYLAYLWRAPSMAAWEEAYQSGICNDEQSAFFESKPVEELYLTEKDPWEVNNLASDPEYADVLDELRQACKDWMQEIKDPGLIPEPLRFELYGNESVYDIVRQEGYPLDKIHAAAWASISMDPDDLPVFIELLNDENPIIRYWGASGLLNLGAKAEPAINELAEALGDEYGTVTAISAECLYVLGEKEKAFDGLIKCIESDNLYLRSFAMNTVEARDIQDESIKKAVFDFMTEANWERSSYDSWIAIVLLDKWGIEYELKS